MMLQKNRNNLWQNNKDVWACLKDKHIFLTGGTGFFGKSLLDLITHYNSSKNLNLKITILTRNPDKFKLEFPDLINDTMIFFEKGDILNFQFSDFKFDYILHLATPASSTFNKDFPLEMFDIVHLGSRRVLEFAKHIKVKSILLASSGAVYGKQPPELTHIPETYTGAPETFNNGSAYGEAKRTAELLGNLYSDAYGFDHKIARCFAFVGPYLDPNGTYAIGNFIKNAVSNQNIIINGDGTDYRSYMDSDDLIFSLLKILLFGKNKQPYNVGSDQSLSILELATIVTKLINTNIKIEVRKKSIQGATPNKYVPSIELIKRELNLRPTISLEDAILKTAEYYKNSDLG